MRRTSRYSATLLTRRVLSHLCDHASNELYLVDRTARVENKLHVNSAERRKATFAVSEVPVKSSR
jgi:hypothetical protein